VSSGLREPSKVDLGNAMVLRLSKGNDLGTPGQVDLGSAFGHMWEQGEVDLGYVSKRGGAERMNT